MAKTTYKDSGVDLELYEQSMARLPRLMRRTRSPRVIPADGGFAGLFSLDFPAGPFARNYVDPVLVACTDGVGTKLKVAQLADRHDSVGIDLVAMCVNDALCCGAEPLFFLDYLAMSHDDPARVEQLVAGIAAGCEQAGMALIGGETAIMPDLYARGDYDLAGFCVGVADRAKVIDGKAIAPGDVLLGIPSSGLHSNGYSLVRKIVFDIAGLQIGQQVPELGGTVGEVLLTPTRIYVKLVRQLLAGDSFRAAVHGIAHITGGGLAENTERILPAGTRLTIDEGSWPVPPVFTWLQQLGEVDDAEMAHVFNRGIGLVLIVASDHAEAVTAHLAAAGETVWKIGGIASS